MDVNFYHNVAAPSAGKGKPAADPSGKGHGVFAQNENGNFLDILFGRIGVENALTKGTDTGNSEGDSLTESALTLDNAADPLNVEDMDAEALLAALNGDATDITNPEILADGAARMEQAKMEGMGSGLKELKKALESLLQGIPAESRPLVLDMRPGQLKQALEKLNINLDDIDLEQSALIATGLDPAGLEELQKKMSEGTEAFIVSITNAQTQPASDEDALLLSRSAIIIPKGANQNLGSGEGLSTQDVMEAIKGALKGLKGDTPLHEYRANNMLQNAGNAGGGEAAGNAGSAGNSTFPALGAPGLSNMFSSAAWDSIFPEGMDWTQNGGSMPHPAVMNSSTAAMTSLVSHAPQAGQPHPASHAVAATITKNAAAGENKNITIRLNPPELGRVEICMEFAEDKRMKAHIIIEKPETHLMLQRDVHTLERALQEAGLDVDNNSLNFELAENGNMFDQDGNNNSGSNASGGGGGEGGSEEAGEELIEATMDWYVDPETGLTRYDILA